MPAPHESSTVRPAWIVGPWFDSLFVMNLVWPLVVLICWSADDFAGRAGVQFWQIYFVTTPHRWITLLIVCLDRQRLQERWPLFAGIAALVVGGCLATRLATGTLTCLLTIDYLWNAWHFAAQHHGIYQIYARSSDPQRPTNWVSLEKWLLRGWLLYVTFRVAGGTWSVPWLQQSLTWLDLSSLMIPVVLLINPCKNIRPLACPALAYLASVLCLYTALLWSVQTHQFRITLALTTASALFHATEYLALVSWSVRQRQAAHGSELGWLAWFATRWSLTLILFVVILGAGGWLVDRTWMEVWLLVNVIMAFLHYAYDGLIWRRRIARQITATLPASASFPRPPAPVIPASVSR